MPGEVRLNRILDWLVTIDVSSQHDKARALYLKGTGQWILAYPTYVEWKEQKRRILWLLGDPGSGKTVLLSNIVEDVKASCQRRQFEVCGWAYYYCDFERGHDELPHLLRWVISQLCRQLNHVPQEVQDLSQAGASLSIMQLAVAFTAIVQRFNHIYIVIDALDEMRDRQNMMDFILHVKYHKELEKVQILVVSRKKTDIYQGLTKISSQIVLTNSEINNDIQAYIHHKLSNTKVHWSSQSKERAKTMIMARASGM